MYYVNRFLSNNFKIHSLFKSNSIVYKYYTLLNLIQLNKEFITITLLQTVLKSEHRFQRINVNL